MSLSLTEGEIVGLIGPNGSGKSTLLNVISGVEKPTAGTVSLDGRRIDRKPSYRIVEWGVAKTHQIPKPFPGMTTRENVTVAALFGSQRRRDVQQASEEALRVLRLVGLEAKAKTQSVAKKAAERPDPGETAGSESADAENDGVDAGGDHQCPPDCAPGEQP